MRRDAATAASRAAKNKLGDNKVRLVLWWQAVVVSLGGGRLHAVSDARGGGGC